MTVMTPPRLVIDSDAPPGPRTYHIDRAPADATCVTRMHGQPTPADVVVTDWARGEYCRACWGPVGVMLRRHGHTLVYTSAALAVWEIPHLRPA